MYDGTLKELALGEAFNYRLRITPVGSAQPIDWLTTPATLTLDSPDRGDGSAITRTVMKYRPPSSSDAGVTYDGSGIVFFKSSVWAAANLFPGVWDLTITILLPTSTAAKVLKVQLPVGQSFAGALNTDA